MPFDFPAFRDAFEAKDVDALLAFYVDDAIWIEYKPGAPPSAPATLEGRTAIEGLLREIAADDDVTLTLSHEVVGEHRIAFRITVGLAGGRRDIEHTICDLRGDLIAEHTEVEAWD